jgi:hypothetical protein
MGFVAPIFGAISSAVGSVGSAIGGLGAAASAGGIGSALSTFGQVFGMFSSLIGSDTPDVPVGNANVADGEATPEIAPAGTAATLLSADDQAALDSIEKRRRLLLNTEDGNSQFKTGSSTQGSLIQQTSLLGG